MVKFVSEISSNHNSDLVRIEELIHASSESGCYAVKFQLFKIEELFATEILLKSKTHRDRRKWELNEHLVPMISEFCTKYNIKFGCTPFFLDAVDILVKYVDFFKIASYELLWHDLFIKCGKSGKPVSFSTGMADSNEVSQSLRALLKTNVKNITIYQCNSAYPTLVKDANISRIKTLKSLVKDEKIPNNRKVKIGYSDHTTSPAVMYRVVHNYDLKDIEFHIDLDGKGDEFKSGHCWLPNQIKKVIDNVNDGFLADGDAQIKPSNSEISDRNWRADPSDGLRPMKSTRSKFV
jgi:sialic acid synthase SpsE